MLANGLFAEKYTHGQFEFLKQRKLLLGKSAPFCEWCEEGIATDLVSKNIPSMIYSMIFGENSEKSIHMLHAKLRMACQARR